MKRLITLLATIVLAIATGCATSQRIGVADNAPERLEPNYTWNWPTEGIVRDKRIDPPLTQRRSINGNITDVVVRPSELYWLDVESVTHGRNRITWVTVPTYAEWEAAKIDSQWQRK